MGKAEFGTPKDVSNRMKLKGLQKLKFYCQMCKKQCRDQNGFSCHLKSETHMYNMRMFAENPDHFLSTYSKEFEECFLDLLKKRYNQKRVLANSVYKEYIGDKQHVHMNGTRWSTLTGFIMYLHETGRIEADSTDRGLYITYVDKGFEATKLKKEEEKRIRLEKKTEQMTKMELEKQMENIKKQEEIINKNKLAKNEQLEELDLEGGGVIEFGISFNFNNQNNNEQEEQKNTKTNFSFSTINPQNNEQQSTNIQKPSNEKKELQAADELLKIIKGEKEHQKQQEKVDQQIEEEQNSDEIPWLQEGITIKIKDKDLEGGSYYNEKAIVKEVNPEDPFVGKIQIIKKPEIVISMDQQFLETVIPKLEGEVMILKPGKYCKKVGILKSVMKEQYEGVIQLKEDPSIQINIPYELFSKI